MTHLLFETFHRVTEGELNPFVNIQTDFRAELKKFIGNGHKLVLYHHVSYEPANVSGSMYKDHVTYWFKDYHEINPAPGKHPILKNPCAFVLMPEIGLPNHGEQLAASYQLYPDKIELAVEQSLENLCNLTTRFHYYNILFETEYNRVRKVLYSEVFSKKKSSARQRYISDVQNLVKDNIEKIRQSFNNAPENWHHNISGDFSEADIYKLLLQYLEGILAHLYRNYRQYMNLLQEAPFFHRLEALYRRDELLQYIMEYIEDDYPDPLLGKVFLEMLEGFRNPNHSIPLGSLEKFEKLVVETYRVFRENESTSSDLVAETLSEIYQHQGLNSNQFIYYRMCHHECMLKQLTHTQKLQYLKQKIRKYKKLDIMVNDSYNPYHPSLATTMIDWCKDKVRYYKDVVSGKLPDEGEKKITFLGSVAEMAAIFRAIYEVRIQKEDNRSEFSKWICRKFCTPKAEMISGQSFHNKFLVVDPKAAERAQQTVMELYNMLERFKG